MPATGTAAGHEVRITGLALMSPITKVRSLADFARGKPEFSNAVKGRLTNIRSEVSQRARVLKRCQNAHRKAKRATEKRLRGMAKRTPGIHVKRQAQPDLCHPLA